MSTLSDFIADATREDAQRLGDALLRGEQLRWAVRPVPTAWTRNTRAMRLLAPLMLAFMAFWTYAALGLPTSWEELMAPNPGDSLLAWFSIPFWLAAFWALSTPWQQKRRMRRAVYAVTDRRALIIEKNFIGWKTRAYPLTPALVLERQKHESGRGDLIFEEKVHTDSDGHDHRSWHGFFNLPDLERAESELEAALRARSKPN